MRIFCQLLNFYRKLIVPSFMSSLAIALFGYMSEFPFTETFGQSYIFISLLFHFFIYEIMNPNEYYFYYNIGISKVILYATTVLFSFIIGIIIYNL